MATNNINANLVREELEKNLKPELMRVMKELGGYASKKEIIQELKTSSETISEEYIDFRKEGRKGNKYRPFDFVYNFSMKEFEAAGYFKKPKRGYVELTEKGRMFKGSTMELLKDIEEAGREYWEQKHKERKNKLQSSGSDEEIIEEMEEEEEIDTENLTESWKLELRDALDNLSPKKFEDFARTLVTKMGIDLDEKIGMQMVADGGLDGFGYITADDYRTSRVAIQAKRWKGTVPSPEIDKFRGAMDKYNAEYGIFITTSVFSKPAIKASREGTRVITLIDGEEITDLVEKYELYVEKVETYKLGSFFTDSD